MDVPASRRPRGRPRLATEPTTPISTRLPVGAADQLIRLAARRGLSVSEATRGILIMALREPPRTPPTNPSK
jgi:hypothetical protein